MLYRLSYRLIAPSVPRGIGLRAGIIAYRFPGAPSPTRRKLAHRELSRAGGVQPVEEQAERAETAAGKEVWSCTGRLPGRLLQRL